MKLLSTLLAVAMIFGLAACSSDEPAGNGGTAPDNKDGLYATLKFKMPQGRSAAKDGEEVGKDYENAVKSILVVMTEQPAEGQPYKFISFAYTDAPALVSANNYTINFENKENLYAYANKDVCIFAYCNPSADLVQKICGTFNATDGKYTGGLEISAEFTDYFKDTDLASTWKENAFLMTSVEIVKKTLPEVDELKTYNTPDNALSLGTVEVVRTAVRFDFKDASKNGDLTYEIKNVNDQNQVQGTVTLTRAALFNLRNQFYYLPRTQADATATAVLCPTFDGMESGFVISPEERTFSEALPTFIDPLNPNAAGLNWSELNTVLSNTEDNDNEWNNSKEADKKGYRIWRYATENTFAPGTTEFLTAQTTGIVFEAKITVDRTGATDDDKNLYLFDGTIYPSAAALYEVVKTAPGSKIETAFNAIFEVKEGKATLKAEYKDATDAAGFTIYRPNTDGDYLCYYFYYNRHNDNRDPTVTAGMEFATVRNNVYKLSVTDIKKFGTFTPGEFDEEWDVYFNLNVVVRPWVVRINSIVF